VTDLEETTALELAVVPVVLAAVVLVSVEADEADGEAEAEANKLVSPSLKCAQCNLTTALSLLVPWNASMITAYTFSQFRLAPSCPAKADNGTASSCLAEPVKLV
jgi:hypothetical protein